MSVFFMAFVWINCCNMPKIEPAFCQRLSLQFLLVTSLCVIDCSVREWDVAVAMLTLGKICTADVTKEIRSSFSKSCSLLHSLFFFFTFHLHTHLLTWHAWQYFNMRFSAWKYAVAVWFCAWEGAECITPRTIMMEIKGVSSPCTQYY